MIGNSYHQRNVLVTGATGFIGLHLCKSLLVLGANVSALSRSLRFMEYPSGIRSYQVDLKSRQRVRQCIDEIKPEIIFHLAAKVDTRQELSLVIPTLSNNLTGSVNLFLALAEIGCEKIVVAGSSEESAVNPNGNSANSPYAAAKEAETTYVKMFQRIFSLPSVVIRPFLCYGPQQPNRKVVPYTITSLLKGISPKIMSGKRICDFTYVDDLINGLLLAGVKPGLVGEIIDIGTGVGTTIYDAVNIIASIIGDTIKVTFNENPDRLFEFPQIANIQKAKELLDYYPKWSLQEGLELTIEWYRNHPKCHKVR